MYPEIRSMPNRHRTLIFWLFTASFFVAAGSIIFYAYGYRFSFERGIFIYTGSLSLKTNVKTVNIKIDTVTVPQKSLGLLNNSIHIAGLNPGEHFIEVSAPGYQPWNKKVVITSGLTTEFWNIYLTEEAYVRTPVIDTSNTLKLFPAPNGLFATIKKQMDRYSVDVIDIAGKKDTEVFTIPDNSTVPALDINIEWSPESHKLIIPLIKDDLPLSAIVDIKTKESFFLNQATKMTLPLNSPRWDATTKDFLFFLNQDNLYRFDTRSDKDPAKLIAEHVAAYDLSGNKLYYLSSDTGKVFQISGNGNIGSPTQITPTPITLKGASTYSLIVYDETRLSVIEKDTGRLFVYNKQIVSAPLKELASGIVSIQYSDDGKKLLFYSGNEISVYFNQNWEAQPFRSQDSVVQVARFSSLIKNVQWSEDYEHVIFSLGKSIKMVELDNRDRRGLSDLLTLDQEPLQILPRFTQDLLYVVNTNPIDDNQDTVFSITLPQYVTNIFGL